MSWTRWRPVLEDGYYPEIPGKASGCYAIRARGSSIVRYVGESHSGRLRKTALRHFQKWGRDYVHQDDRATYDPTRYEMAWCVVTGGRRAVLREESAAMLRMQPTDNTTVPAELVDELEPAPF